MNFHKRKNIFVVLIMTAILTYGISFSLHNINGFASQAAVVPTAPVVSANTIPAYVPPQKLSNPPATIKAVYVTGYSAGTPKYLDYLANLFKTTQINAVVVDIKDSAGNVSYDSGAPDVKKYHLYNGAVKDIDSLVNFFHSQNIYVIGRIANFEDPVYSKARPDLAIYNKSETTDISGHPLGRVLWKDNNGLSWLDPSSKDVWNYNISLAKDAFYHGFDEINFDYVRFPSDGKTNNMGFPVWDGKTPEADIIKNYFQYARANLSGQKISVDLFGQTTTNKDDMGIGQLLENAFENFDYVSPMVYPSHYANNFLGFANPADHPYEIIDYAMATALSREKIFAENQDSTTSNIKTLSDPVLAGTAPANIQSSSSSVGSQTLTPLIIPLAKFRPWLQDFNMGADYNAGMIDQEIKATQDSLGNDYNGFMLWNPSNIYTADAVK